MAEHKPLPDVIWTGSANGIHVKPLAAPTVPQEWVTGIRAVLPSGETLTPTRKPKDGGIQFDFGVVLPEGSKVQVGDKLLFEVRVPNR